MGTHVAGALLAHGERIADEVNDCYDVAREEIIGDVLRRRRPLNPSQTPSLEPSFEPSLEPALEPSGEPSGEAFTATGDAGDATGDVVHMGDAFTGRDGRVGGYAVVDALFYSVAPSVSSYVDPTEAIYGTPTPPGPTIDLRPTPAPTPPPTLPPTPSAIRRRRDCGRGPRGRGGD